MTNDLTNESVVSSGLSQIERVVDTFVAPSKTFADIRRSTSWWLPFLLMVLFSGASGYVVDHKVGFDRVYENSMRANARAEEAMSSLTPDQRAKAMSRGAAGMKYTTYAFPVILIVVLLIYSLLLWASFNFGLGAETTFSQVLAVSWYASLPYLLISLLGILTVSFGGSPESYDIRNPVGTNLGYYFPDSAPWLKAMLSSLDVVKIWSDVLQVIGMSIIAKKTIAQSAVIVGILWLLGTLMTVGAAAAF